MKRILTLLTITMFLVPNSYAINDLYNEDWILQPFHIEGKLCNPNDFLWDDACEDFLFQSIFGPGWRDIKKAIMAFQQAIITKNPKHLKKYLKLRIAVRFVNDPEHIMRINHAHAHSSIYVRKIFTLEEFKRNVLDKLPDYIVQRVGKTQYKDVRLENGSAFVMLAGDKRGVVFLIDHTDQELGNSFYYIPKIDLIELDFKK